MKKLFFTLLIGAVALVALAQYERFDASNSYHIETLEAYAPDAQGYLVQSKNPTYAVDSIDHIYAYDKKTKTAYVQTARGNYAVMLKDDMAKQVQKDKSVNKLKGKDLQAAIEVCNIRLKQKAEKYNLDHEAYMQVLREQARQKRIEDSIKEAHRQDSLARVREAERLAQEQRELQEYRKTHDWHWMPRDGAKIKCLMDDCDNYLTDDSIYCFCLVQDTIYYATFNEIALGKGCTRIHYAKHTVDPVKEPNMAFHIKAYADSLYKPDSMSMTPSLAVALNLYNLENAVNDIQKMAPYGFIEDWGWGDDYGTLTFNITYCNLNKKTIKYLDVYWVLKNDVNDTRGSGHFKGTGPVDYLSSGSWEWDNTLHFVAGDATTMYITKIIITYMNGTTKVLTGKNIIYN